MKKIAKKEESQTPVMDALASLLRKGRRKARSPSANPYSVDKDVWWIVSALRGPDIEGESNELVNLKCETTGRVRGIIGLDLRTLVINNLTTPPKVQIPEIEQALGSHFTNHIMSASGAIWRLYGQNIIAGRHR